MVCARCERVNGVEVSADEERELEAGGDVVPGRLTFPVKSGNL